jgi:tetratricopeptide (TPR) repeat protein
MSKREAKRLVREHGGVALEGIDATATLAVVGEAGLPLALSGLGGGHLADGVLDDSIREAAERGTLEVIPENEFWQRIDLVETQQNVRRLYTPAMLAELIRVQVAVVRRWHRRGLIVPARVVRKLPYFDFQEVASAKRLAELLAGGASPAAIEKQLAVLAQFYPGVERPLSQLSVIVEGRELLLRQGDGLLEPGGQYRFDFQAAEVAAEATLEVAREKDDTVEVSASDLDVSSLAPEELIRLAGSLEDAGQLDAAIEAYRAVQMAAGPSAEVSFLLAELLYRVGDLSGARERYYMAIELDEEFVEARANLGCILAESGQHELAVAAFEGALRYHRDYPDAHYHLARTLDELNQGHLAVRHWQEFLALAPETPWADEARSRLDQV